MATLFPSSASFTPHLTWSLKCFESLSQEKGAKVLICFESLSQEKTLKYFENLWQLRKRCGSAHYFPALPLLMTGSHWLAPLTVWCSGCCRPRWRTTTIGRRLLSRVFYLYWSEVLKMPNSQGLPKKGKQSLNMWHMWCVTDKCEVLTWTFRSGPVKNHPVHMFKPDMLIAQMFYVSKLVVIYMANNRHCISQWE